jgi:uncharacterized protein YegL
MQKLPIYIVVDSSQSMEGDPIEALNSGVSMLHQNLLNNPQAVENAWMSVIACGGRPKQVTPLTEVSEFQPPVLRASGELQFGAAIHLLCECMEREISVTGSTADWRPLVMIILASESADSAEKAVMRWNATWKRIACNVILLLCGDVGRSRDQEMLTGTILQMKDTSPESFAHYFEWVEMPAVDANEWEGSLHRARLLYSPPTELYAPPAKGNYDVFISAKSEDNALAAKVYDLLSANGIAVFWSERSLARLARANFREAIDDALEASAHCVVVTSSAANVLSPWVKAEWGMFINELRSGNKTGNVITVLCGTLSIKDLPISLRPYQAVPMSRLGEIVPFLTRPEPQND